MKCECCGQEIKQKAPKKRRISTSQAITTYSQQFNDGYKTGLGWDASWFPGGPHHWNPETEAANRAWQAGFGKGLNQRLQKNPRFAKWWNKERRNAPNYSRYTEENQDERV